MERVQQAEAQPLAETGSLHDVTQPQRFARRLEGPEHLLGVHDRLHDVDAPSTLASATPPGRRNGVLVYHNDSVSYSITREAWMRPCKSRTIVARPWARKSAVPRKSEFARDAPRCTRAERRGRGNSLCQTRPGAEKLRRLHERNAWPAGHPSLAWLESVRAGTPHGWRTRRRHDFELDAEHIAAENRKRLAALEDDYDHLGRQLARRGIDIEARDASARMAFRVSVPPGASAPAAPGSPASRGPASPETSSRSWKTARSSSSWCAHARHLAAHPLGQAGQRRPSCGRSPRRAGSSSTR